MKRKLLCYAAIMCIVMGYGSCYKTGEIIPQLTCKPDSLVLKYPMYNNIYTVGSFTQNFKFAYDNNRRLLNATLIQDGIRLDRFDFNYDGNNNIVEIDEYQINLAPYFRRINYTYPTGTKNSISFTLNTQVSTLANAADVIQNGATPAYSQGTLYTYNFNTEYQLASIFDGQTQADSIFLPGGDGKALPPGSVGEYYAYSSYDNQINPGRSDRVLQLFLFMYSKNNPTSSAYYQYEGSGAGFQVTMSTSGAYSYNIHGYPTLYQNVVFADYSCLMAPNIAPGPLARGN
jgi:hypothetical protein